MSAPLAAVFVSYASADAEAARRIRDALVAAGVEVWLDESELRGGDAWDTSIRKQIRECGLFVPVVSARTDARAEGYFRLEWRLAIERSRLIADDRPFVLPVVVDGTQEIDARVPDAFREKHWSRLTDPNAIAAFAAHVRQSLESVPQRPAVAMRAIVNPTPRARRVLHFVLVLFAAILIGAFAWKRHADSAAAAPSAGAKAIAVMPFDNLSGRAEDAYLADGLQEEILNSLARLRDLTVISRSSTRAFRDSTNNIREIGRKLNVGSVLQGSIRRDGNALRLSVELIDARDDRHLFAANYDRELDHVLDLQSEVAHRVAEALSATLTQYERGELDRIGTNSGDAYDRYLRAIALFRLPVPVPGDDVGVVEPRRLLEESLRFDPDYADAWALLSQAHSASYFAHPQADEGEAAKQAFERAFALDPMLPEALLARGVYEMYVSRNLPQAVADLQALVRLRPNSGTAYAMLGFALRRQAKFDEALPYFARAVTLDPLNQANSGGAFVTLLGLRRFPEAIERTIGYTNRNPDEAIGYFVRARLQGIVAGNIEPLRATLRERRRMLKPDERKMIDSEIAREEGRYRDALALWPDVLQDDPFGHAEMTGSLQWAAGDTAAMQETFRALERDASAEVARSPDDPAPLRYLAVAQSMLGRHDEAIATIERAQRAQPESTDAINGPAISLVRSILLQRAGRTVEAYAEVERLIHVPFGAPTDVFGSGGEGVFLLVKDDPRFDALLHHPPRL